MSFATTLWMRETQAEPNRTFHRSLVVVGALVVVLILTPALVHLIFYPAFAGADDAFIHVAVAEHILRGDGWGIVSHDRVNLSSSPFFTILLLAVLPMGSIGLAEILSLVFACAALAITFFTTRRITASIMCGLAALVVAAANAHLWRWSGTVMETALAYLSVTLIAVNDEQRDSQGDVCSSRHPYANSAVVFRECLPRRWVSDRHDNKYDPTCPWRGTLISRKRQAVSGDCHPSPGQGHNFGLVR